MCAIRNLGHCDHDGQCPKTLSCKSCEKALTNATLLIREVNPIFSRAAREIMYLSRTHPIVAHNLAQALGAGFDLHFNNATTYLDRFELSALSDCLEYQSLYCRYDLLPFAEGTDLEYKTGLVYPGRGMHRPCISFKNMEFTDCNKKYPVSKIHSPGLFTVQCICGHPKIIGFRVMTHAESISMAVSAVITHFKFPPRTVFTIMPAISAAHCCCALCFS